MSKSNVREVALEILISIEKNQSYSNLLLNKSIETHKLNPKDTGLLTELVYGTIQRRDALDYFMDPFLKKKNKIEKWVKNLLRLSLYQMVYLDRIPERAAIFEAVEIAKRKGHKGISSMVNGVLRSIQREGVPSLDEIKDPVERIAVETSHPVWLVKRWADQMGIEEARRMCEENLRPPAQTARANTSKLSPEQLIDRLASEGFEAEKGILSFDAIKARSGNMATTKAFKDGLLTIQDESSMLVARALGVEEGERVLDSCAAPGGKTTHIAELLKGTGSVVSLDLHEHKVKLIKEQAERIGLPNVSVQAMDARKAGEHFDEESFDKILVDAPCSGLGVIRRKPDIKFSKNESDIKQLAAVQLSILHSVAPLLKKGGRLVYSTCTIDREENGAVVEKFLKEHPEFSMDQSLGERLPESARSYIQGGEVQLLPHYFGTDGFYIASLRKQV